MSDSNSTRCSSRIPVGPPEVILLAAFSQKKRLAICVHLASPSQNAAPDINHDLDQRGVDLQHLMDLPRRCFSTK